jgi:E3 ubiquitin-protein ligase SHPRH
MSSWIPDGVKPRPNIKDLERNKTKVDKEHDDAQFKLPEGALDWASYVNSFDVCITTYNVLTQDLAVARAPPTRPRRSTIAYRIFSRPRSPLVMCEFHRVIMDEVQLQGGGKTE